MTTCYFESAIGSICIEEQNRRITHVYFPADETPPHCVENTPLLQEATVQIEQYLHGTCTAFNLPINPKGTPFMHMVWARVCKIPYGQTASYKAIVASIG